MIKFKILALLAVIACVQIAKARDITAVLDDSIRKQLNLYEQFQKDPKNDKYSNELKQLVSRTAGALKAESAEEKNQIISSTPSRFSVEFNSWISSLVEEVQVNADIQDAIAFYKSLLNSSDTYEDQIKNTIKTLENLLEETDLKEKEDKFLALGTSFSADFENFIKKAALPNVNRQLTQTAEFFKKVLKSKDVKFSKEIEALKEKTEAALGNDVPIDAKNKVLHEVTFTDNEKLNEFLRQKHIEYS